jgi:ABC-type multidrug transport system fused ATPase/permease subunit
VNKKLFSKLIIYSIILLILIVFYFTNIHEKSTEQYKKTSIELENQLQINDNTSNIIYNVEYETTSNNVKYLIKADSGTLNKNNKFFLNNVYAEAHLNDGTTIFIKSEEAIYDNNIQDTKFATNVMTKHEEQMIFSQKMDIIFSENYIKIYDDVIYKKADLDLTADIIKIDLNTKNLTILMENKSDSIVVKNKILMAVVKKFRIKSFKIKQKEIIEFKNISLSFNNRKILDNINFSIYQNEIVGLLGPNGVGKSTIFNLIIGLLKPQSGSIEINNEKINSYPIYTRSNNFKIGYVPQYGGYFQDLNVLKI